MGKFKMPTVKEFYKTRQIYNPIKEPVWVYIEREMRENEARKPYNTKVANWLLFLKDLRYHYFCEAREKYNRLWKECGPEWYLEYSNTQRQELSNLKRYIHEDVLENVATRVKKCLWDLGITLHISTKMLMSSMTESKGDPGVFLWILYSKLYKTPPSELLPRYDLDAMLMMSALVFLDMEECLDALHKLTTREDRPQQPQTKRKTYYFEPNVKYGAYLQKLRVPCYSTHPSESQKPRKPMPLIYTFKLRSEQDYERSRKSTEFLKKRMLRNIKASVAQRPCNYKFWEAPACTRGLGPAAMALAIRMKMFKMKPKTKHVKYKPPYDNIQCHITSVVYCNGKPYFSFGTYAYLPTGHEFINGGLIWYDGVYVQQICGMTRKNSQKQAKCDKTCDCVKKCEAKVKDVLDESKCRCGHFYDHLEHRGKPKEIFFCPPTRHTPFLFKHTKIYQLDSWLEYVDDAFRVALFSETPVSETDYGNVQFTDLTVKEILKIFLADLAETPLLIPHLPQCFLLNSLQEWVRRRINGNIGPERHKQLLLRSQRRWLDLKHIDFRAQAYFIPFSLKQLEQMTWSHRSTIQKLFEMLLHNFEARTRRLQLEQCRLWWSTMAYDAYPNKSFLDVFFTYMPGRYQDTLVLNPYSPGTMTYQGRTCALNAGMQVYLPKEPYEL